MNCFVLDYKLLNKENEGFTSPDGMAMKPWRH